MRLVTVAGSSVPILAWLAPPDPWREAALMPAPVDISRKWRVRLKGIVPRPAITLLVVASSGNGGYRRSAVPSWVPSGRARGVPSGPRHPIARRLAIYRPEWYGTTRGGPQTLTYQPGRYVSDVRRRSAISYHGGW